MSLWSFNFDTVCHFHHCRLFTSVKLLFSVNLRGKSVISSHFFKPRNALARASFPPPHPTMLTPLLGSFPPPHPTLPTPAPALRHHHKANPKFITLPSASNSPPSSIHNYHVRSAITHKFPPNHRARALLTSPLQYPGRAAPPPRRLRVHSSLLFTPLPACSSLIPDATPSLPSRR